MSKKRIMLRRWGRPAGGFSVLEQALVLPVFLFLIAGAVDINSMLQAHSALSEGVTQALRCAYTSDGKCVQVQTDTRARYYNYYAAQYSPEYLVDTYDFRGTASWINRPEYEYSNFRARVLDRVSYTQQTSNISVAKRYFAAHRTAQYVLRTARLPFATGTSARSPVLRYRGVDGGSGSDPNPAGPPSPRGTYPSAPVAIGSLRLESDAEANDPPTRTLYQEFQVPPVSAPVLESQQMDAGPNQDHSPRYDNSDTSATLSVAIHVTGNKSPTTVGSRGGIEIDLEKYLAATGHWVRVAGLGAQELGRAPGEDARANFVIRGLPPTYIDESIDRYSELHDYSPLLLERGARYRILFTLHRETGRVGWQGEELRIYYPVESPVIEELPCNGGVGLCDGAALCQLGEAISPDVLTPDISFTPSHTVVRYGPTLPLSQCSDGSGALVDLLASHGLEVCAGGYEVFLDPLGCSQVSRTQNCPAPGERSGAEPNYGVPELPNAEGIITESETARAICSPPSSDLTLPAQILGWTERVAPVPNADVAADGAGFFRRARRDCASEVSWPEESHLPLYRHLSFDRRLVGEVPLYTGEQDPAALLMQDGGAYHCADFTLGTRSVDVTTENRNSENAGSLFSGYHVKPGCDIEATLHADALTYHLISPSAFFKLADAIGGGAKVRSATLPAICVDPEPELVWGEIQSQQLVSGGPFLEGDIPPECRAPNTSCMAEFARFGGEATSENTFDLQLAAEHFGFEEVRARYPRARLNCTGSDCVRLALSQRDNRIRAEASLAVPLYVLGRHPVEIKAFGEERLESAFSH